MSDRVGLCLCGHGPDEHCPDGECINGGVASDRVSFVCGCTRWRTKETEAARAKFRQDTIDWYRAKGDEDTAKMLEGAPLR